MADLSVFVAAPLTEAELEAPPDKWKRCRCGNPRPLTANGECRDCWRLRVALEEHFAGRGKLQFEPKPPPLPGGKP